MFRGDSSKRTLRQNAMLAGYLALVAGYVNSAGFVVVGTVTSHVTGNVARFAHELVSHRLVASGAAALLVAAFFGGAFVASVILESLSASARSAPNPYGVALFLEALLLALFVVLAGGGGPAHLDGEAAVLGMAMGMQNSLVTRLSGAVVRTTHLTGVVTDLGIEAARWARWRTKGQVASSDEGPSAPKLVLLLTIATSFTVGAVAGGAAGLAYHQAAMLVPSVAIALGAIHALTMRDRRGDVAPQSR